MTASVFFSVASVAPWWILNDRMRIGIRGMLAAHADLARKLEALERKYDGQFRVVFEAIQELMEPPGPTKKPIGFRPKR